MLEWTGRGVAFLRFEAQFAVTWESNDKALEACKPWQV